MWQMDKRRGLTSCKAGRGSRLLVAFWHQTSALDDVRKSHPKTSWVAGDRYQDLKRSAKTVVLSLGLGGSATGGRPRLGTR
jgi:hypothetical protein